MVQEVGIHPYVVLRTKRHMQSFARYVVERLLRIKLDKTREVHHINRDSLDNRLVNLVICTVEQHTEIHSMLNDGEFEKARVYVEGLKHAMERYKKED